MVTRKLVPIVLGVPLALALTAPTAVATPADGDVPTMWRDAAGTSSTSWSKNDPRGDERATAAMRKRYPKKARAVDLSRQRYVWGASGLTVMTHLKKAIRGKAPYRQFIIQKVVGTNNGAPATVRLRGRTTGKYTATLGNGKTCSGAIFNIDRTNNLAVSFIPTACLPDRLTRVDTISFNERGPSDISVDRMSSTVPH